MLSKSKIFFKGIVAVLPHMLSVIPFGIITGAIGIELGFDPILVYATSLIIFGGEFGRTIYSQGKLTKDNHGRDHHGRCFSMWIAGGGFKAGFEYGKTDDYAYNILENPVHVNDLNATVLQTLGIDHERFTYKYLGLDQRLTGVDHPKVIPDLLA